MKRRLLHLLVALLTFCAGLSVSDYGECNRPFGPLCCGMSDYGHDGR
jgi:hypothetical protein